MRTSQWIASHHLFDALKADSKLQSGLRLHMNVDMVALLFVFKKGLNYIWTPSRHLSQARSQFKSRSTANNVSIMVPVPSDADSPKFKTSTGSAKWVPEKSVVQWNIKSFPVSGTALGLLPIFFFFFAKQWQYL